MRNGIDSHIIQIVEITENHGQKFSNGQILCKMSTITITVQDFA